MKILKTDNCFVTHAAEINTKQVHKKLNAKSPADRYTFIDDKK